MNNTFLASFVRVTLFSVGLLFTALTLTVSNVFGETKAAQKSGSKKKNMPDPSSLEQANQLISKLYTAEFADFAELFGKGNQLMPVGAQSGYYGEPGTTQEYSPLVIYKRVWVYDAGIALSLAIQDKSPTADARALWLLKNAQYTRDPDNPGKEIFAGWPYSKNQRNYGDNWTDCRFINGANIYAIQAIAEYITSDYYRNLDRKPKAAFSKLFADALSGVIYHIESSGPNEGLITAGWSLNVLEEFSRTKYTYNQILDMLGYGPLKIEGYPDSIRRVRVRNVITEHCINLLKLLNYTLDNYDKLFEKRGPYTYNHLDAIRRKLRESIYAKLYDNKKRRFITGRSSSGEPSAYTAIDNASWLSLALDLDELNEAQIQSLSESLVYTINNFTKTFKIADNDYFGAHYFEDGFEDPYIEKSDVHSKALHVEATCGLICGLIEFANTFPSDPNSPLFRITALKLWTDIERFVDDFGFVYASTSLKDVSEPIEASVSAIWYLRTYNYLTRVGKH